MSLDSLIRLRWDDPFWMVLTSSSSSSRSFNSWFKNGVWSSNSGVSWPMASTTLTITSQSPTSSYSFENEWFILTFFQTLSNSSISPSFKASVIVSSVLVPMMRGTSLPKLVSSLATKSHEGIPLMQRLYSRYPVTVVLSPAANLVLTKWLLWWA